MKSLLVFSVVCLQFWLSYGNPVSRGGGVYSFQDSNGHRYGGSYELEDGKVSSFKGDPFSNFIPDFNSIFPQNFMNFGGYMPQFPRSLLPFPPMRPFPPMKKFKGFGTKRGLPNLANKKLGADNPKKKSDITNTIDSSNNPNFGSRFNPFFNNPGFLGFGGMPGGMPNFNTIPGFGMPNMAGLQNFAAAGGAAGPGLVSQFAAIGPENPANPNVEVVNRFAETPASGKPQFYSVSSSSHSSSSNLNGQVVGNRAAETVVNDNGKITKFSVHS